jgi:hypothetical protein
VDLRRAGRTRRWRLTIVIVAALSLFVALVAGSSLRPNFAAAELPEPAAWTHGTQHVASHPSQLQLHTAAQSISHLKAGALPSSMPVKQKPFRGTWMTHDRPTSVIRCAPPSVWLALPASFAASGLQQGSAHGAASAATPVERDMLADLCVIRC